MLLNATRPARSTRDDAGLELLSANAKYSFPIEPIRFIGNILPASPSATLTNPPGRGQMKKTPLERDPSDDIRTAEVLFDLQRKYSRWRSRAHRRVLGKH